MQKVFALQLQKKLVAIVRELMLCILTSFSITIIVGANSPPHACLPKIETEGGRLPVSLLGTCLTLRRWSSLLRTHNYDVRFSFCMMAYDMTRPHWNKCAYLLCQENIMHSAREISSHISQYNPCIVYCSR